MLILLSFMRKLLLHKGGGGGRGVKEKQQSSANVAENDTVVVSSPAVDEPMDTTMNTEDVNVGQTPNNPTVNPKPDTSYANLFTAGPSRKAMNFRILFTLGETGLMWLFRWNLLELLVHGLLIRYMDSFWESDSQDGLNAMLENGPWFIRSHPIILKKWNPDVNLLKEDVGNVPVWVKLHGVPVTAFSKDGLSAIATKLAMIELRADVELKDTTVVECPKNPGLGAGASETKNPKKTSQAPKGFPIGPKMAFKPNQEYRPVTKKHTANSSSNKKKGVNSTSKVSDSNLFEVLNSVDNDVEMGTNRGTSNLDKIGVNSSGSSFWNVKNSSTSTTPIMDKIGKFEDLIIDGKATLVDEAGNPMKKVEYLGDNDSEDEVSSVDNDVARSLAFERTVFGTQSLLAQWTDSYRNGDYDEDPYDDDMYEGQDLSKEIQTICDKLDIRVRGPRMKKYADKKRRDLSFASGDYEFVKLHSYRQHSIVQVAYKLEFPATSHIHPVFHVSFLKPCVGDLSDHYVPLPLLSTPKGPLIHPIEILDSHRILVKDEWEIQVLVH
ncbi:RNA-directed DNA polymerase, eukaryota, reverse transcriptase zinc-binding domain protein [Tanacetum coccineum]